MPDCQLYMETPAYYQYLNTGLSGSELTSLNFQVMACRDAHIGLGPTFPFPTNFYEIVIGAGGNTKSAIR